MATAKKRPRAPREVWVVVDDRGNVLAFRFDGEAAVGAALRLGPGVDVVGPYVLKEKKR